MPGSPPNTPRVNAPRYSDADTAAFSAQVNAVADAFDAFVAKRLTPHVVTTGTGTAASGECVVASLNTTINLPTPTSEHDFIRVLGATTVTGAAPVAINRGGAALIFGKGLSLSGVTSVKLGTPTAFVDLFSWDGTNWLIVGGEQDTGWVALTLKAGVSAAGSTTPAARLKGDTVYIQGQITHPGGASAFATAAFVPTVLTWRTAVEASNPSPAVLHTVKIQTPSGDMQAGGGVTAGTVLDIATNYSINSA